MRPPIGLAPDEEGLAGDVVAGADRCEDRSPRGLEHVARIGRTSFALCVDEVERDDVETPLAESARDADHPRVRLGSARPVREDEAPPRLFRPVKERRGPRGGRLHEKAHSAQWPLESSMRRAWPTPTAAR